MFFCKLLIWAVGNEETTLAMVLLYCKSGLPYLLFMTFIQRM